jgi:hypothetical protein
MSAIDFGHADRTSGRPQGERVKVGMIGKFLRLKCEGVTGNAQAYRYGGVGAVIARRPAS